MERRITILLALALLGCRDDQQVTPVTIALQVDRASCGIAELDEYPLPTEMTLAVGVGSGAGVVDLQDCRVSVNSDGRTLADLALVAEDADLALEVFFDNESANGTLSRVSFGLWSGLFEGCEALASSAAGPVLSGESGPFQPIELPNLEDPTIAIAIACLN